MGIEASVQRGALRTVLYLRAKNADRQEKEQRLLHLREEQKRSKIDSKRNESLKNEADLKAKKRETKRDLTEALKEQKRLEMVHTVCLRNLAKNEEWINCLEQEIKSCGEMIAYLEDKIHLSVATQAQRETEQKTREELFRERQGAIQQFVGAMRDKTAALSESPAVPAILEAGNGASSQDEPNWSGSFRIEEVKRESTEEDVSPKSRRSHLASLKIQESDAGEELAGKLAALRTVATIAGVDDPAKTEEIVKYFKQTEELEA